METPFIIILVCLFHYRIRSFSIDYLLSARKAERGKFLFSTIHFAVEKHKTQKKAS